MKHAVVWADRGRDACFDDAEMIDAPMHRLAAARSGCIRLPARRLSLWIQVRGESWIEALEGRFRLQAGDWIVLDKDSAPTVQASASGLCLGLILDPADPPWNRSAGEARLYPGRGSFTAADRLICLRLWRRIGADRNDDWAGLPPLLGHMAHVQRDLQRYAQRCPGRTRGHRHQVFSRLQRARLYMKGHRNHRIHMRELAALINFSSSYFSRTYTLVYEEQPQATATRLRLDHAADLLLSTAFPISEIAMASGFENGCSFSRAFRARFGVSASDYRKHVIT